MPPCGQCKIGYAEFPVYKNQYFMEKDETPPKSCKPKHVFVKPKGVWKPPTIYQRSYLPTKAKVEIVGPPVSKWLHPTDRMDGLTMYQTEFGRKVYQKPHWRRFKPSAPKTPHMDRISEYTDNFQPLTAEEQFNARPKGLVPMKRLAARNAALMKSNIKPPINFETMYVSAYKPPTKEHHETSPFPKFRSKR
ncbi:uncharacterized protein LOC129590265 [Paramacrobiotus metropolitanus]|uniref:uncharacterized protein LOC129590265 n=1 Tax=Paramacrobiotus metropolitanus TaxID=2943436 RepID=UPI00244629E1|nr:uncharacterized protein LOC129590265 [Paramacrobiotus metropolitanus]